MAVLITNQVDYPAVNLTSIRKFMRCCLKMLKMEDAEVSLMFTDDATIRALNRQYRREDKATDILSFGMREHCHPDDPLPPHRAMLGDLVVSMDHILKQAKDRGVPWEEELIFIISHGLLHLIGYDHDSLLEKKRMETQQTVLLNACRAASGKQTPKPVTKTPGLSR